MLCVFLFSTPASLSPLVLFGHSALPPPRGGSASRHDHDTPLPDFHDTPPRNCIEVTKITRTNFRDVEDLLSPDVEEDV